jgi:hypothetical protein
MDDLQQLQQEIYRRKIEHARKFTGEQRLLAALQNSEAMISLMRDSVRHQHPTAAEDEVLEILTGRINRVRDRSSQP